MFKEALRMPKRLAILLRHAHHVIRPFFRGLFPSIGVVDNAPLQQSIIAPCAAR
jgi:hypothetical protein